MRALPVVPILALALAACGSNGEDANGFPAAGPPATDSRPAEPSQTTGTTAQKRRRGYRLVAVGRFRSPLFVTSPPGDRSRIFVVEQDGRVVGLRGGKKRVFLDIREQVTAGGEQGLLGLAFAPDYAESGRFYVYFTDNDAKQRLVGFRRATADRADKGSAEVVFVHDDPEANHNGGMLVFGPDRHLYVGTGDGGGGGDEHGERGNAQDLGSPLGKILRLDPKPGGGFTTPSGNPFRDRDGARPEVYSYGLRNPWRFSFDRRTGDLTIGDVGQNAVEEIDFVRRGRGRGTNFGWRPFEGRTRFTQEPAAGHVPPVITHGHDDGWCSITGGYVVRDPDVPALAGRYVYGDFCKGRIYRATLRDGRARDVKPLRLRAVENLSSFGEDARGRVYVTSLSGPVYRLASR